MFRGDLSRDGNAPGATLTRDQLKRYKLKWSHTLNGAVDGTPLLRDRKQYCRWHKVMTAEYRRLLAEAEAGRPTLLDEYGTTSEAEFFAVATECFFDQPAAMARRHPRLYEVLRDYFRQDPAAREAGEAKGQEGNG